MTKYLVKMRYVNNPDSQPDSCGTFSAPSYLQDVFPLCVLLAAQPPLFEEAAQFEAEQ